MKGFFDYGKLILHEKKYGGEKMDPITHGVIGLALSSFSGNPVTLTNPVSLGCAIGAMAPDIDIVTRFWGDYVYLKHHRGISHSLPILFGLAGVITLGLSQIFQEFAFAQVFLWSFIGCLSHTFFDILNSYGAKLFMPFTKSKQMVGILMLYDPVISVLCLMLIFYNNKTPLFYGVVVFIFLSYLGFRLYMKYLAKQIILNSYEHGYKIIAINVLPSLLAFHKWDYIVNTNSHHIVGQVNLITKGLKERKKFKKPEDEIVELFEETNIGRYFRDFTPIYHVIEFEERDRTILKSIDLRYYLKNNFMHHATAIYDKEKNVIESFFHPYKIDKKIPVTESN